MRGWVLRATNCGLERLHEKWAGRAGKPHAGIESLRTFRSRYAGRTADRRRHQPRRGFFSYPRHLERFRNRPGSRASRQDRSRNSLDLQPARDLAWTRQAVPGRSRGWFARSPFDQRHAAGIDRSCEMSRALDPDRSAACRRCALFWPHARPANEPALERRSFAVCGHPRPDLDRRDRRGVDGQPAARWTFVRGVDFAALRAGSDFRRRGGRSGGGFDGPLRNPLSDPLRRDPDRDRRRAFRGGFCFAADNHVSSVAPGHENPQPVSEFRELNGHSLRPADMIGENQSKHSKFDRGQYAFENLVFRLIHLHPALTMAMAFLARRCEARMCLALAVHVKGFGFWLRCGEQTLKFGAPLALEHDLRLLLPHPASESYSRRRWIQMFVTEH